MLNSTNSLPHLRKNNPIHKFPSKKYIKHDISVFSLFWIMKFMQMYFQWNIISPKNKIFSLNYRLLLVKTIPTAPRKSNSHIALKIHFLILHSTSLRFMFYGNVETITREEIWEKKVIFFHLALNNIAYDSVEENWTGREMFMLQKKKSRKTRKINQNVHTSFVSFDWQSNMKQAEARTGCCVRDFDRKSYQLINAYNQHFRSILSLINHTLCETFSHM